VALGAPVALQQAPSQVPYHRVLAVPGAGVVRSLTGVLVTLLVFVLVVPVLTQGLIGVAWLVVGSPGEFAAWYREALAFQHPGGMAAVHLGIASLTLIAMGATIVVHRVHPRWLASVQPGVRWRFGLLAAGAAVLVLNGALWLSRLDHPWAAAPHSDWWVFLIVIVLTAPLQALGEEVFFRGYLLQALGSMVRAPWFGIGTSALIFALFHGTQNLPLFLDRFAFGILAGALVWATGGLEAAVAAHVVNNVFAFGYAVLESSVAEVKAIQEIGWIDALFDVGGFAAYTGLALLIARRLRVATLTP
jgi:membrane protease YdiL (CAAX protease family)